MREVHKILSGQDVLRERDSQEFFSSFSLQKTSKIGGLVDYLRLEISEKVESSEVSTLMDSLLFLENASLFSREKLLEYLHVMQESYDKISESVNAEDEFCETQESMKKQIWKMMQDTLGEENDTYEEEKISQFLAPLLFQKNLLSVNPSLQYRVSRSLEEENSYLGFSLKEYFLEISQNIPNAVLINGGTGSGMLQNSFITDLSSVQTLGVSDKMYFSLDQYLRKNIAFYSLEKKGETFADDIKSEFSCVLDVLLRVKNVVKNEKGFLIDEDSDFVDRINANPFALREIVSQKIPEISEEIIAFFLENGIPDDNATQTQKGLVFDTLSPLSRDVKNLLQKFLKQEGDFFQRKLWSFDSLGNFPQMTVFSDFSQLKKLENDSIDIAYFRRSSAYIENPHEYKDWILQIAEKASTLYIDDSVRKVKNQGFRIAELREAFSKLSPQKEVFVVCRVSDLEFSRNFPLYFYVIKKGVSHPPLDDTVRKHPLSDSALDVFL